MPLLEAFCVGIFYKILIYSSSLQDHIQHPNTILDILLANQFCANFPHVFAVTFVAYLGHVISAQVVEADTDKIKAIHDWPPPYTLMALQGFLGLSGFYRRIIRHESIASPVINLPSQPTFTWPDSSLQSFKN